jgi:hypothetical protein
MTTLHLGPHRSRPGAVHEARKLLGFLTEATMETEKKPLSLGTSRNTMKKLLLALAVALTTVMAVPAHATDWWVLDFQEANCRLTKTLGYPTLRTPYDFERAARQRGTFSGTFVAHKTDGSVGGVLVRTRPSVVIAFFPTRSDCLLGVAAFKATGMVNDPNELR